MISTSARPNSRQASATALRTVIGAAAGLALSLVLLLGLSSPAAAQATSGVGGVVWLDADEDGTVDPSEARVAGAQVKLRQGGAVVATTVTAADGSYAFAGVDAGNYGVQVVTSSLPPGATPTYDFDAPANGRSVARLAAGETEDFHNFGYAPSFGQITGLLWDDENGDGQQTSRELGLPRVEVKLRQSGAVVATATTVNGVYVFNDVPAGTYRVQAPSTLPDNYFALSDDDAGGDHRTLVVAQEGVVATANFSYEQRVPTITGRVWIDADSDGVQDFDEGGAGRLLVKLRQGGAVVAQTNVSSDGSWSFADQPLGSYAVQIVPTSNLTATFDPQGPVDNRATFVLSAGETEYLAFGYVPTLVQLAGVVWDDATPDGIRSSGEPGLSGVTLQLRQAGALVATTTTNAFGEYEFTDLARGSYAVVVVSSTAPGGPTFDVQGAVDGRAIRNATGLPADQAVDFGYGPSIF